MKKNAKEQKKEAILTSALDEFSKNGIDASRIEDIAKGANLGKGTFYLYFKSKDDLLNELIQTYAKNQLLHVKEIALNEPDCQKALYILVDEFISAAIEQKFLKMFLLLLSNAQRNPKSVDLYKENVIQIGLPLVVEILQNGVKSGVFKEHESEVYALLLFSPAIREILFFGLFEKNEELKKEHLKKVLYAQLDLILSKIRR